MNDILNKAFENTTFECVISKVPDMPDHVFSKKFEREMQYLIKQSEFNIPRKITIKKMFTYIMVAIIAACTVSLSVCAIRYLFKNFFMESFDTHTVVKSTDHDNAPTSLENIYTIQIPDGFELTFKDEDEIHEWTPSITYTYNNDEGNYILFTQYVKQTYNIAVNTENRPMEYISINENEGYIVDLGNNEYYISWDNGDYIFEIIGDIDKNKLISLAEFVKKAE